MFTIEKRYKNANIRKPIRFTEDLLERMLELKEEKGVSFNELVLRCCDYALDNLENEET